MVSSRTALLTLAALACFAVFAFAQPIDDELEAVFRSRRTAQGVMRGYAGISRRGQPLVFAGGYASNTRLAPRYAAAPVMSAEDEEQDEDAEPMQDEEEPQEEEQNDEVEEEDEEEQTPAPVKPQRGSRKRPQKNDDDDVPSRGGVSAIATSISRGNGASSKSHAVAYGGRFSGGQFRHRF